MTQPQMTPIPYESRRWVPLFPANVGQQDRCWINKPVKVTNWYINWNKVPSGGYTPLSWGYVVELGRTVQEQELLKQPKLKEQP